MFEDKSIDQEEDERGSETQRNKGKNIYPPPMVSSLKHGL